MREEARHRAARGRAASAELQHVPSLAGARARHPYPSQVITVKGARDDGLQVDVYAPMTSEIVHTTVVDRRELFALGLRDARVPRPLDRRHEPASARARAGLQKGALRRRRRQGGQFVDAAAAAAALGGGA